MKYIISKPVHSLQIDTVSFDSMKWLDAKVQATGAAFQQPKSDNITISPDYLHLDMHEKSSYLSLSRCQ